MRRFPSSTSPAPSRCCAGTAAHFRHLREDKRAAIETNTLHLDLLSALKSVNDCLVAGAAYPILEERGELRQSRLRAKPSNKNARENGRRS